MKKILLTGASGFIGQYLVKYKPENLEIKGTYFSTKPDLPQIELVQMDLSDIEGFLVNHKGKYDCIIHCAAEASLGECDKNPEKAFLLNSVATEKLARWSQQQKSRFAFLSTDIVFDGKKELYNEMDIPEPVNIYGKSKLQAEQSITKIHKNAVIIRLALCMGRGIGKTTSFIDLLLSNLENNQPNQLYYDEFRTPVSANFAAETIWTIAQSTFKGIVHLTGTNKVNRYDLSLAILDYLNLDKKHLLHKVSSSKSTYPRPKDVSMQSNILQQIIKMKQESFSTFIKNIL
jgi:dTDP-4-dehydrorhamnose reductase